tara:strand:- start:1131 stop:1895 length:765 start_codon:yes stop_codon:yes gene_type:complete
MMKPASARSIVALSAVAVWLSSCQVSPATKVAAWEGRVTPSAWLVASRGEVVTTGLRVNEDESLNDPDVAFAGRIELWRDAWGVFVDGFRVRVSTDVDVTGVRGSNPLNVPRRVAFDAEIDVVQLGVLHRLVGTPSFGLEGAVGASFSDVDGKLRFGPVSEEWVDVHVGMLATVRLSETLEVALRGGLEVDDATPLAWSLAASASWRLGERCSFIGGYRAFQMDARSGRNWYLPIVSDFDVLLHGPFLGLRWEF